MNIDDGEDRQPPAQAREDGGHEATPGPDSDGDARKSGEPDTGFEPILVQLHAALKQLDHALFEARRALDVALDRSPDAEPPTDLPYRELRRLAEQLKRAGKPASGATRAKIQELLDAGDGDDGAGEADGPPVVGVAPSGKLRSD